MASSTTMEMEPGQILSDVGADLFRRVLEGGEVVRCSHLWIASAHQYDDGGIEIEICCSLNRRTDRWDAEIYYFDLDRALIAIREYESTGNIPEGE
jgi:hypothetical protein